MNAIILSVGDELVLGQTVDTNSAWISQQLAAVGCGVVAHMTVGDDQRAIEQAIRESAGRCDFLIVSGGIGPTEDDLTRQALGVVLGQPLELSEMWMERLRGFFEKRGRRMPETNRIQAMIPHGAQLIDNTAGTAAGIRAVLDEAVIARAAVDERAAVPGTQPAAPETPSATAGLKTEVFVMPGVPKEMKIMFARDVLPTVESRGAGAAIVSRTLHTLGLGESWVAERLGELMQRGRNPSVGTTVSHGIVSIRVNSRFDSRQRATEELQKTVAACRAALGDLIFGEDDETLPQVVGQMLRDAGRTVATAESCTGGLLAKMLTDIPGSSAYFTQGWVTYTNESKSRQLAVPADVIRQHGAVSEPTVTHMAAGALERSGSQYACAISGVAGPDGGTPDKPVGTVCIAFAWNDPTGAGTTARTFNFPGDREMIRDRSAKMALAMVRYHLMGKAMPF